MYRRPNIASPNVHDVNSLAQMGITLDDIGHPQPWSRLIQKPPKGDLKHTAWLLTNIDKPKAQDFLARMAHRELSAITAFFDSLEITYFFVGLDKKHNTYLQRCGPDRKHVLDMLQTRPSYAGRESTNQGEDKDKLDRIWQAVLILTDELTTISDISFSLLWNGHSGATPELDYSGDCTRQDAWDLVWLSLPYQDRCRVLRKPPPRSIDLEEQRLEPAPPSTWESDPAAVSGIAWYQFQQNNFDCSPDWRWNRAWSLVRHHRYVSKKRDDAQTGDAVRFLRRLIKQPQNCEQLADDFPNLLAAHEIRTGHRDHSLELESRLLARQSSSEIAERLSISAGAVDAYVSTFFDIRSRLNAKSYIVKKIIGMDSGLGSHPLTLEELAKQVAYFAGSDVLDVVLPYIKNNGRELARRTAGVGIQDPFAERLDLLLRANNLPTDNKTSMQLTRVAHQLIPDFSNFRPKQNFVGAFAQIVEPFAGEIVMPAGEQVWLDLSERRAA